MRADEMSAATTRRMHATSMSGDAEKSVLIPAVARTSPSGHAVSAGIHTQKLL